MKITPPTNFLKIGQILNLKAEADSLSHFKSGISIGIQIKQNLKKLKCCFHVSISKTRSDLSHPPGPPHPRGTFVRLEQASLYVDLLCIPVCGPTIGPNSTFSADSKDFFEFSNPKKMVTSFVSEPLLRGDFEPRHSQSI
jgi:hypothetical protein